MKHRLDLQAFAEEAMSAGGTGGTDGSTDTGFADQSDDSGLFSYESDEPQQSASPDESGGHDGDDYQAFREKYKDRIGEEIQGAIQKRFKNQQSYEDSYNSLVDGLAPLFLKYGLDGTDIDGLKNALSNDDSLYEDLAYDEGLTPEAMRDKIATRQENARLQKELDKMREEEINRQASRDALNQYNDWLRQADEMSKIYPNFDLAKELENEDFRNDLINSGKSLQKVYESAHLEEILAGAIQTTANKTREATINNIRARGMRPPENGTRRGSVKVKKDVNELTDKDIDDIMRRVKKGEKVTF